MKITVQRLVEVWIEETYNIDDESQVQDAINHDIEYDELDVLWETEDDLGSIEVYDENWKLLYKQ